VAFSDWLKGFGLIAIIDHGDGFMSLYASTDALLRAAGDWVEAGEVIALAGSSGGQAAPGVYFELRRDGRPVDPARWLKKK
jgi:septal ring factor EnvC (AmiA/AmiB activator)